MLDKVFYLSYCVLNAFFYALVKYIHVIYPEYSVTDSMACCNVVSFAVMVPYMLTHVKKIIKGFKNNWVVFFAAPASILKCVAMEDISPKNAMIISFMTPVIVTILSFIILKEFEKRNMQRYIWIFVSMIGAAIFVGTDALAYSFAYMLMFGHVFIKGFIHVFTKQLSKDKYLVLFYTITFHAIMTVSTSLQAHGGDLSLYKAAINPMVFGVGFISVVCQFCMIQAYKMTHKLSLLQNLDYSRILFSCAATYIFFDSGMSPQEVVGVIIVMASMTASESQVLSNYSAIALALHPMNIKKRYEVYRRFYGFNIRMMKRKMFAPKQPN